jgi:hypothetical protein
MSLLLLLKTKTVRASKNLHFSLPSDYPHNVEIRRNKLDRFTKIIGVWLAEDRE